MYLPNKIRYRSLRRKLNRDWNTLRFGGNTGQSGRSGANWYLCFLRKQPTGETKNVEYRQGIAVSRVSDKSPIVSTSSHSGIQALFYGFDMDRMLKGLLSELALGNMG